MSNNLNSTNSMSQDYHQQLGIFSCPNGFERSQEEHQQLMSHDSHQIRRDKLIRVQGFQSPPVAAEEEVSGQIPAYETAGMLSEMFNFPPEWYGNRQATGGLGLLSNSRQQISTINADSAAAAMQLFHLNPQPRSPSPPGGHIGQFTWVQDSGHEVGTCNSEIGGHVVEGQGLSLSLSSSLLFNQGGSSGNSANYVYKNLGGGSVAQNHQVHIGFGTGVVNGLRNSKYVKAAQELLEEFCSVGRCQFKKNKFGRHNNTNMNPNSSGGGGGDSSSSTKDLPTLTVTDRVEHQRRKVKLLPMLDEVDRRYNHYCEQMQTVVNSFDLVMGFGSAVPYTTLAQKAMSKHFRCLKDAITAQLKHSCELLGDKDAGTSGVTKGETPRLRLLEQSLRQQRAFHQMGMMEQEAWRPQRGLPERSVNILRAWLFEHFLHPYPSDADKHLLARQTGLSRNQVSNWFINARVRLWKPMVEDMYQQESKEESLEREWDQNTSGHAQTPTPTSTTTTATAKRFQINAQESDPSLVAINTQCFPENAMSNTIVATATLPTTTATVIQSFPTIHEGDRCHRSSMPGADYGTTATTSIDGDIGSTFTRFGTARGDVSLTLGLRHAGNPPERRTFSVRDFGDC
ncbi:BEL1-like homeodomain protein 4 [Actinidia chinensis var. chinensis]|uniref:BEL1-like homeodomain protein 4 n=1 Tax=Actinidia chinensis var. chinensis TaxID=1590841 RepID=A0A2R6R5Q7_ACTCC|nr:BEL1-like homeodomain protein 4 [Actinidia chinensis var. chinensis]